MINRLNLVHHLTYKFIIPQLQDLISERMDSILFNIWGTDINILDSTGTETKATFSTGGSCTLSWTGATKFQTTTNGATITGALTAGGLTYPTTNGTLDRH